MLRFKNGILTISFLGYVLSLTTPNANNVGKVIMAMNIHDAGVSVQLNQPIETIKPMAVLLATTYKESYATHWGNVCNVPDDVAVEYLRKGNQYLTEGVDHPYTKAIEEYYHKQHCHTKSDTMFN